MDKLSFKRGSRVLAPSLFTVGNMACGFYAILSVHEHDFPSAAPAILAGMVFDSLDGRVARLVHGESVFGVEFDSLSDFLTFGIAPAIMIYGFILKDYGAWGYPLAFLYALCGALRLARFNISAQGTAPAKNHFTGLPIPAGAGFLASFVLLYQIIEEGRPARTWNFLMNQIPALYALVPGIVLLLAFLMISTIPYPTFKNISPLKPHSTRILVGLVLAGLVIFRYPQNAVFIIFFIYVLLGPIGTIFRTFRRLLRRPQTPS